MTKRPIEPAFVARRFGKPTEHWVHEGLQTEEGRAAGTGLWGMRARSKVANLTGSPSVETFT